MKKFPHLITLLLFANFFLSICSFSQVITGGMFHTLALCSDSTVKSFGNNQYGELGDGTLISKSIPGAVNFLSGTKAVVSGQHHSIALKKDSTVWAWGLNQEGRLGDGTTTTRKSPVQTINLNQIVSIACGASHTLALKKDSTLWAWGDNSYGKLSIVGPSFKTSPTKVNGLSKIISMAGGSDHTLALKSDGTVWAWGKNSAGQLGDGTGTQRTAPGLVIGLTGIIAISCGQDHSLALKNDGTVWAWGANFAGQLGDGTLTVKNIPIQVQTISDIIAIACGDVYSFVLKSDGTVYSWGLNQNGQLGIGSVSPSGCQCKSTPNLIVGLSNVNAISSGWEHSIALKNNGTVWTWGFKTNGGTSLGIPSSYSSVPFQITGLCLVSAPLAANILQTNCSCFGTSDGSATIIPKGGIIPYSYLWSNGQTSATANNLSAGSYSVTVTDSISNTTTASITITSGAQLSYNPTNVSCNAGSDGAVDLDVTGGSGNFSYLWSNGSSTQDVTGIIAGSYTVTFIDATCVDSIIDTIIIGQPAALTAAVISAPITCGNNNGSASVTVSGGVLPYSYLWSNGNTTSAISNLPTGNYTVTVTDANGCISTTTIPIVQQSPALISNISSQTNELCNLDSDGSATVSISSGTPGYTYAWSTSPVQTTSTAIGLSAGSYTVTVTDTNGCISFDTSTITVSHPMNVTANATSTIIFPGTSVTLTGSGTTSYFWSGGVTNGLSFVPLYTNTYTVTGTDGSSCSATATITITVKHFSQTLSCGGLNSLAVCTNGPPKVWGDNTYGQLGDGTITQKNAPVSIIGPTGITGIDGGYYHTLFLKNDGTVWSCGNNFDGRLGDGTTVDKKNPVQVVGLAGVIAVSGGRAHSLVLKNDGTVWSFGLNNKGQLGNGTLINKHTPIQVLGLSNIVAIAAGYYHSLALKNDGTVWAWGDNGWGQLGTNTAGFIKTPQIVSGLSGITALAGGENHSVALKDNGTVWAWGINSNGELGNGTNTYSYSPVNVSGLINIVSIEAGMSHSLALKDNGTVWTWGLNGWGQLGDGTNISSSLPLLVNSLSGINAIAGGGAHSMALKNDGSVWAWGLNLTGQIGDGSYVNNRLFPVQVSGLCTVTSVLTATISQTNNICLTDNNGTATIIPNGGIAPYIYLWSNGQTTATVANLIAGTYTVTVTDAINNSITLVTTILGGTQISSTTSNPLCNGGNNGTIDLIPSEGGGNFSYSWSNGIHTQDLNGLTSGSYTVTIIDGICADTLTGTININDPLALSSSITSVPATCGNNNGSTSITPSGGILPYTYLWSTGDTTFSITGLMPGNYTVTIIDANGCTFIDTSNIIQQYPAVNSSISSQTNVLCNGGNTGNATVVPNGGTPGYSFFWSTLPSQTTQTANNLSAGTYNVKITDLNGCICFDSVTISQSPPVPVTANSTATVIFPGHPIVLTGGGASSYIWSGGVSNGITFIPTSTNTYTLTGTDGNGCSNTTAIIITVKKKHHIVAAGNSFSIAICSDNNVMSWGNGNAPVLVSGIDGITDLETGQFHSLALKNDGVLWAWGQNGSGVLGNGTTTTSYTPTQVVNLTGVVDIAGGNDHSLALKNDGTVWGWGGNSNGQLGDGTLVQKLTPVQVNGLTGIIQISAGIVHSIALKDDGTVWAWGNNPNGQLGDSTNVQRLTPVQVKALSGINAVSACGDHSLALKNDGTVWSWGANSYGQLGVGSINSSSFPLQVNVLTGITDIETGVYHSLAMKNDSIIFGWGNNSSGQIADIVSYRTTPTQLTAFSNPVDLVCGYHHSIVLKNDGTMWTTGSIGTTPYQVNGLCPVFIDQNVWPGDADKNYIVNNNDLLPIGLYYGQTGFPRTGGTNNSWQGHLSANWGITQNNNFDIKHADCNGDGTIDANDTLAINLNFNLTHAFAPPVLSTGDDYNRLLTPIYIVISGNSYNGGDWVDAEVWLGNSTTPVNNLYGISFNINYDASLIQPGTERVSYPTISWLGTIGTDAISIGKVDPLGAKAYGAVTRTDQTNKNGFGKIADFKFQIKNSITSPATFHYSVSNYMANDLAGVALLFNPQNDSILLNQISGISEINNAFGVSIYPNPFNHQTTITFNEEQKNTVIKIIDVLGKEIKTLSFTGKQLIIEKRELKAGIYFVQIVDGNKNIVNRKIIIQ